jgi:hypothetical protein
MAGGSRNYLIFCVLGSRVFGANMGGKILIAPLLVLLLHFIKRFAGGCSRRIEHPRAFRATVALKILPLDPHQFAAHSLPSTTRDLVRLCFFETWRGIGFRRHCDDKSRSFHCLERRSAQVSGS